MAQTIWTQVDLQLPKSVAPGELLIVNAQTVRKVKTIYTNNDKFTDLSDGRAFAVTGLTGKPALVIYGVIRETPRGFASPASIEFYETNIALRNPPLKDAPSLRLPSSVWKKLTDEQEARIKSERVVMKEILAKDSTPLQLDCWKGPLRSSISSQFASPRTLPNGTSYYHSGLDLRAQPGYPVRAVAASHVAFADEHFVPGRMIVLDHGGGLFSRYMHLDSLDVKPGDVVKRGQIIGRTGATGRVEAPHLHWEVLWKGNYANPETFLRAWGQICDPKLGV